MVTNEAVRPKRKLILSMHTVKRLDLELFRSIAAPADSNSQPSTCAATCADVNAGPPPLAVRRP